MSLFSYYFAAVVTHRLLLRTEATCCDIKKYQINIGHVNAPLYYAHEKNNHIIISQAQKIFKASFFEHDIVKIK